MLNQSRRRASLAVAVLVLLTGCEPLFERTPAPAPSTSGAVTAESPGGPSGGPTGKAAPGTVPPPWLGTRVLPVDAATGFGVIRPTPTALRHRRFTLPDTVAMLPGDSFASDVVSPAPSEVIARSTWQSGCPVSAAELAWVRVTFVGFDGARHTGELLVNASVASDVVTVFRALWQARFPLEEMRVTRPDELDAPPTGDGNNTGAFVCRAARGSTRFSEHAYGLAIDVNPFQNPYTKGAVVLPELASSYVDRSDVRPGMVLADGPVVAAFARIGWGWGGAWSSLQDRQHFSLHDR